MSIKDYGGKKPVVSSITFSRNCSTETSSASFTVTYSGRGTLTYTAYATPTAGGSAVTATGSSSTLNFTGLTEGTEYTLTGKVTTSYGVDSDIVSGGNFVHRGMPTTVTGVSASSGNAEVTVSWTDISDWGTTETGISNRYYLVYFNTANNFSTATAFDTANPLADGSTSKTVTGLTNGTEYFFWVVAFNASCSSTSASVSATPVAPPYFPPFFPPFFPPYFPPFFPPFFPPRFHNV
jgi:hypothetical protein